MKGIYHSTHARAGLTADMVDSLDDLKAAPIIRQYCGVPQLFGQCHKQILK